MKDLQMYYPPNSNDPSSQYNQPTQQNQFPGYTTYNQGPYGFPPPSPGQFQYPPQTPKKPGLGIWFARQTRRAKIGIGCGVLLLTLTVCLCSTVAFAGKQVPSSSSAATSSSA